MAGIHRRGRDRVYRFEVHRMDGDRVVSTERVELLEGQATVGRTAERDIVLPTPDVSRLHALLRLDGETVTVMDSESTGGFCVNGTRVREPTPVGAGDAIEIGDWRIVRQRG